MERFFKDLRYGLRQLRVERGFSIPAILTLSLGIGAAITLFLVVNAVLLKELPYGAPGQLVALEGRMNDKGTVRTWSISERDFMDWRERSTAFSHMSQWGSFAYNLEQGEKSQRLWGELVNASYLSLLGLKPQVGRFFTPDEDARPMEQYVVVLGDGLWRSTFGADPKVVGRKVRLNGRLYQVVGVGPRGFRGLSDQADLWVPSMLPPIPGYLTVRQMRWVSGTARLKPGVTVRQAQQEMNRVTAALYREFPDSNKGMGATVVPIEEFWFGKLRKGLLVLTAGACILLLIACINVASLLMTRAVAKQRDWAMRVALGASRERLVRQALTESALLSFIGAAAGFLLGQWAAHALLAISGIELPSFVQVTAELGVIAPIIGLVVLCSVAFGLASIWVSFRTDLARSLGRDEKLPPRGRGWRLFQNAIVIAQVALALTLSIDAALMANGFRQMIGQSLGFRADNLLTFRMALQDPKHQDTPMVLRLLGQEYLPRLTAVPGVQQLAMSTPAIPTDDWLGAYITIEDHDSDDPEGTYLAVPHAVTPAYFEILGIPIEKGRGFNLQDTQSNAVIVSKALAEQHWPGQNPLGKRLKIGLRGKQEVPWLTVVGVCAEVAHQGFADEKAPVPDLYVSLLQFLRRPLTVNFLVRPRPGVSIAELRSALHREMAAIDPEIPDYDVATMQQRLAKQTGKARFLVILIGLFACLALVLAAVGIYGVISYSVSQRKREIAIRVSLGATRGSILRMIVGRGAVLAAAGLVLGLTAVFVLSRFLVSLLYQTSATDPLILAGASLGLFLVTLAANYLPARRAAIRDPMIGLRLE